MCNSHFSVNCDIYGHFIISNMSPHRSYSSIYSVSSYICILSSCVLFNHACVSISFPEDLHKGLQSSNCLPPSYHCVKKVRVLLKVRVQMINTIYLIVFHKDLLIQECWKKKLWVWISFFLKSQFRIKKEK